MRRFEVLLVLLLAFGCDDEPEADSTADAQPMAEMGPTAEMGPLDGAVDAAPADATPLVDVAPPVDAAPPIDVAPPDMAPECSGDETRVCALAEDCTGLQACVDGVFGACEGAAEVCDGVDDDCDGAIDEGLDCGCAVETAPQIDLPPDPEDFQADQDIEEDGWNDGGRDAFDTYGQLTVTVGDQALALDMSPGRRRTVVGDVEVELSSRLRGNVWTVTLAPVGAPAGPLDVMMEGNLGSDGATVARLLQPRGLPVLHTTDDWRPRDDPPVFTALVPADPGSWPRVDHLFGGTSDQVRLIARQVELPVTLIVALSYAEPFTVADDIAAAVLGDCMSPAFEVCGSGVDDDDDGAIDCADPDCAERPRCDPREGMIRLADGRTPHTGRLEVWHRGEWGTVCALSNWNNAQGDHNGAVVCRELGHRELGDRFARDATQTRPPAADLPVHQGVLRCAGDEARLRDCTRAPLGLKTCTSDRRAYVDCVPVRGCADDAECRAARFCVDYTCVDELPPEDCGDGVDNDRDGRVDCDDFLECAGSVDCIVKQG